MLCVVNIHSTNNAIIVWIIFNQKQTIFILSLFLVFHYNVAEAQLELHRQNMEWCIGTIAKARNRHVDVEPEVDERPDMIWG